MLNFQIKPDYNVLSWYATKALWEAMQTIYRNWKAVTTKEEGAMIIAILEEIILFEDNSDIELQMKLEEVKAWMQVYEHYKVHSYFQDWTKESDDLQTMYVNMGVGVAKLSEPKLNGEAVNKN